jgi:nicotinamide mononucleotide transporter
MPLTRQRWIDLALETAAVGFSLAFTLLYLRALVPACYLAAFAGSSLFAILCWRRQIFAESALHLFYVAMAVYGLLATPPDWRSVSWPLSDHLPWLVLGGLGTALVGHVLSRNPRARSPYLDAFTTSYSLIATALMLAFVHENWLYWIVIDSAAVLLYALRRLYLSAGLFLLYLAMAIDGYFASLQWFS